MSTFCHGIASCQALDKSGEIVEIKGLDITSLPKTGILNYEHKSDIPGQICGKILTAKKIFTKDDCKNEHEEYFWNKCKVPFVYITAELLDDYCQSGKDAAGLFRYDHDKKDQNSHAILGFSVEGSEIPNTRKGVVITRSIARKVTLTAAPCNSQCIAEILINTPKSQVKDDFDEIFKSSEEAITLFKSGEGTKIYEEFLAKKERGAPRPIAAPKNPSNEYENQGTRIGKTKSGKTVYSHGHIGTYDFNPSEHKEASEHHSRAAVHADNPKLIDNHIQRMKQHNNAALSGGRQENRAALSLVDKDKINQEQGKEMNRSEKACKLHKAQVPGSKYPPKVNVSPTSVKDTVGPPKFGPIVKSESSDWSPGKVEGSSVHYHHPEHGTVSIQKQPSGEFHVKHQGKLAGVGGVKGSFTNPKEAGSHAKKYMKAVSQKKILAPKMQNISSDALLGESGKARAIKKAIDAGSYNAAPSTLTNGAAYQRESMGSSQATTGAESNEFQATKKKDWNKRAKDDYETWPHREKFEKFMQARMPHLKLGEIQAIGRVISLKKNMDFEKSLGNLISLEKSEEKLGSHFLMSAENPMHPAKNKLKMNHEQTLAHLKSKGYKANTVKGHYGSPETSIMVHNVSPKQSKHLHHIASELGQDSSIYSHGGKHEMKYHHGENAGKTVHGEGTVWHAKKPDDFYTTLPSGKHFTHNFDFSKSESAAKELSEKSLKDIQIETASKWADRAEEAYKKAIEEKSIKWLLDADEYFHESIEHSSLSEDLSTFEKIRAKLMPIRKEAFKLLAPGADS